MTFSLRAMLIFVAAFALLLAQYPYVWFYVTRPAMSGGFDGVIIAAPAQGYYVPTARFLLVLAAELSMLALWRMHSQRAKRLDQLQAG